MVRSPLRVPLVWLSLMLVVALLPGSPTRAGQPDAADGLLVYHQITNLTDGSGSVGDPVLSADGTIGVFADAPGTGDPETPNRVLTVDLDGGSVTEVDAYVPLCFCGAILDISNDGETIVSSDSVQIRVAAGGIARELVTLSGSEITAIALAGDGETVFFLVRRDTATMADATPIPRGIWAIDTDGENLRQVVGIEDIADLLQFPVEQAGCCWHGDGRPLAVSDDGNALIFGVYAFDGEHVVLANGDGGDLRSLAGPNQYVMRVAVSGDGSTVAWDALPVGAAENQIASAPFGGGEPMIHAVPPTIGFRERLQLTEDGSSLLVNPDGLLIETESGDARLLAVSIFGMGGNHEAVLTDGLARATMNADGSRFLYAIRTVRCADCANLREQLAILDIDPADPGDAPEISDVTIEPAEIGLAGTSSATITASVETASGEPGVGFVALLDDRTVDPNLGVGFNLLDDGVEEDATAGDGVFTIGPVIHSNVVTRDPDTGPRTIRIAAEYEASDGMRHATAVDAGILTVLGG